MCSSQEHQNSSHSTGGAAACRYEAGTAHGPRGGRGGTKGRGGGGAKNGWFRAQDGLGRGPAATSSSTDEEGGLKRAPEPETQAGVTVQPETRAGRRARPGPEWVDGAIQRTGAASAHERHTATDEAHAARTPRPPGDEAAAEAAAPDQEEAVAAVDAEMEEGGEATAEAAPEQGRREDDEVTQHGSDEEEEHDDPATLMAAAAQEVRSNPDGILMLQCKVGEEAGADPTWELQKEVAYVVADFVGGAQRHSSEACEAGVSRCA